MATQEATQPESSEPGKTFTQEDVNRIVQERLARERNRVPSDAEKTLEEREKQWQHGNVKLLIRQ